MEPLPNEPDERQPLRLLTNMATVLAGQVNIMQANLLQVQQTLTKLQETIERVRPALRVFFSIILDHTFLLVQYAEAFQERERRTPSVPSAPALPKPAPEMKSVASGGKKVRYQVQQSIVMFELTLHFFDL